jgi:hypothetical protein
MRSFVFRILTKYSYNDQIKEYEMGRICSFDGREVDTTFWQKPEGRDYWPLSEGIANTATKYFTCMLNIGCHEN